MAVRYSVIIPSHNRAQQLLLTLVSFETQSFPKHLFEVIVVDDGSTDGTREMIEEYGASYTLTYLFNPEQRGRSFTRNLGLREAKGLYIIFCDADFVVLPEFIYILDRYHRRYPRAVLSGIPHSWSNVYTHYHPDFSPEEKEQFRSVLSQSNLWKEEYETADQVLPVITPDDLLHSTGQLSKVVLPSNIPPNVLQQFGRTDVAPWILLITRCVSIRHKDLTRIGGFNDRFINHGLEDWDLGYRLHRLKIPFHSIKQVVGYHQEHPAYTRGVSSNIENLKVMYELYGFRDPELNLFALIPAWEDVEAYKHTIRVLRKGLRFKSSRSTALLLKRTLRISAKFFFQPTNLEKHQNSLGIIRRKLKFKKSSRPATIVLRRILDKTSEFISNVQSDSH